MCRKLILLDIDGTLANYEKKITAKTKEALLKAEECGCRIMLASGRTPNGLCDFAEELHMAEYHGYLLCYNGARMIDYSTGKILFDQTLSVAEELAVLKHLKQFKGVHPIIDLGEYMLVEDVYDGMITLNGKPFNVIQYESRGNHFLLKEVKDLSSYLDVPVNKILTFGDPEYLQEHYQAMMEPFKDTLSCMFTGPFYFEFMPQGIDKAKALKTVFGNDGYQPEDMIAFGDGQNDVSMIRYAGLGIGMANAVDELKEAADELTSSCDEDGIAEALYRHLPELK